MGNPNFCGYLISRFYTTREICENSMHVKNWCFRVVYISGIKQRQGEQFKVPRN